MARSTGFYHKDGSLVSTSCYYSSTRETNCELNEPFLIRITTGDVKTVMYHNVQHQRFVCWLFEPPASKWKKELILYSESCVLLF